MSKNIIMQVLTSSGYEPMYPFNPSQVLNATFLPTSTATQYNLTINGVPTPLTNSFGNMMGIISFIPTVTNGINPTISINGDTAYPILFPDGTAINTNTLIANRPTFVKYNNNNFYLILDKSQVGLSNVNNTSDIDKPISTATQNALNLKLNTPTLIPANSNLNSYTTGGLFYTNTNSLAATIVNTPTQTAFSLLVEKHIGTKQTVTAYTLTGIQTWVRNYSGGTWSSWTQQAFVFSGKTNPDASIGADGNIYLKYE